MADRQTTSAPFTTENRAAAPSKPFSPGDFEPDNEEEAEEEASDASSFQQDDEDEVEPNDEASDHNNTAMASAARIPNKADPADENIWIQLYHHVLLIASLQPTEPTAWLYNTNQLQDLDTYINGQINSDGIIGESVFRCDSDATRVFEEKRAAFSSYSTSQESGLVLQELGV